MKELKNRLDKKVEDGKEDRKPSHYAELQQMMDDLQSDYYFYNRMLTETRTLAEHNTSWLHSMVEKYEFIRKSKVDV